jgi:hypothetical protein
MNKDERDKLTAMIAETLWDEESDDSFSSVPHRTKVRYLKTADRIVKIVEAKEQKDGTWKLDLPSFEFGKATQQYECARSEAVKVLKSNLLRLAVGVGSDDAIENVVSEILEATGFVRPSLEDWV